MYLVPNVAVGGAELIDYHIIQGLMRESGKSTTSKCAIQVLVVFESLLRQPIRPSDYSSNDHLHAWHDRYVQLVGRHNVLYLDHLIDASSTCADESRIRILNYLAISRAVQLVFNRNTYIGYSLFERWRTQQLFPTVCRCTC
jgi:hypothetical protein